MNIPLNIDWQQILLHLMNFAILAGGLYLLLYKPVKDFMDKRAAYYEKMDADAKAKLAQAGDLEASYKEQIANIDDEIAQKRAKASREAEAAASKQIESAKAQAEKILTDAQENAQRERQKIVDGAGDEIAALAASLADKLVQESLDDAYNRFLDAAERGGAHEE